MNARISMLVALLASLGASAAPAAVAAPPPVTPMAFSVRAVTRYNENIIARGSTAMTVLQHLGTAHRQLSPDVWVYHGFRGSLAQVADQQCSVLLITLRDSRVADIKLVNTPALRAIVAQMEKSPGTLERVFVAQR